MMILDQGGPSQAVFEANAVPRPCHERISGRFRSHSPRGEGPTARYSHMNDGIWILLSALMFPVRCEPSDNSQTREPGPIDPAALH